jgi:hypothetical protein
LAEVSKVVAAFAVRSVPPRFPVITRHDALLEVVNIGMVNVADGVYI